MGRRRREPVTAWDIITRLIVALCLLVAAARLLGWVLPMLVGAVAAAVIALFGVVWWIEGSRRLRAARARYRATLAQIEAAAGVVGPPTSQDPQNG